MTSLTEVPMQEYTNKQAVIDVIKDWIPGTTMHGPEVTRKAIHKLRQHGSSNCPMDATVTKYLRTVGREYGIVRQDAKEKSLYLRRVQN